MRKRDLGILLLSYFVIFFSLQSWLHLTDEYPIKYDAERLPPPVVVDLNGDGKLEVLVATHDAKIQVLELNSRRVNEGFSEARVLAEVSLLPDKVRIVIGRRPVAMAAGIIDRSYKHGEMRKQVLVAVTSGWSVMCFDHNLKKLWENNLQDGGTNFKEWKQALQEIVSKRFHARRSLRLQDALLTSYHRNEGPRQPFGSILCGYYVLRFMRHLMEDLLKSLKLKMKELKYITYGNDDMHEI